MRTLDRVNTFDDLIWVEKLGANIETLRSLSFEGVPKYCPKIRHLYLGEIELDEPDAKFWETVGENLETLSIEVDVELNQVKNIDKYCRKIKCLQIRGYNATIRYAISKCAASYGGQLQRVQLIASTENQVLRVKSACPNARIELFNDISRLVATPMIAGSCLEEATVVADNWCRQIEHAPVDWSGCTNIEKVHFLDHDGASVTLEPADLRSFFKYPKSLLRTLNVSTNCAPKSVKDIVSLIARETTSLIEFKLKCKDPSLAKFNELVYRNKSLSRVYIEVDNPVRKHVVEMVKTFLKSASLKKLEVVDPENVIFDSFQEFESVCHAHRRVYISVLGVSYLR